MTVECITCDRLSLRDVPVMAKHGLGRCAAHPRAGVFVSIAFSRDCAKHVPANAENVEARREWRAKKAGRA